uniref:Uncharacterized protein n=1 Tax=Siphoviridae sp. ctnsL8 TaxID=2825666 RepID=A0A8S5PN81_9CAUD|nr:MAG TPA: hypothetical protein [Siphoviridae sp. ctnsL8]
MTTECKTCSNGINCINGRFCAKLKMYVQHKCYSPCKNK